MMDIQELKILLTDPRTFFERLEERPLSTLKYYALLLVFVIPFQVLIGVTYRSFFESLTRAVLGIPGMVLSLLIFVVYFQIILYCFGARDFTKTLQAIVYGGTPVIVTMWLPGLALLASLYSFYLTVVALEILHDLPLWRVVTAYILGLTISALTLMAVWV